jgi:type II secretory pathway predicted ATPase ExeA
MYETHFRLNRRPFPPTPDLACYYPSTTHEAALATLLAGLEDGEGVLVLTGPPGSGKTLLAHALADRLVGPSEVCLLANAHTPSRAALLQALLYDLGLPYQGSPEQEMRLALTDHLLNRFREGRRAVLLIDEAHLLTAEALEEVRLFGNLEWGGGKAVQTVLIGQPELLTALERPELASLRQRLAVRATLEPLGLEEAADYLLHHLRAAGGGPNPLLTPEALEMLARASAGCPRLLNQSAHLALRLAATATVETVDAEAATEAISQLGLPGAPTSPAESGVFRSPPAEDDASFRLYAPVRPA